MARPYTITLQYEATTEGAAPGAIAAEASGAKRRAAKRILDQPTLSTGPTRMLVRSVFIAERTRMTHR